MTLFEQRLRRTLIELESCFAPRIGRAYLAAQAAVLEDGRYQLELLDRFHRRFFVTEVAREKGNWSWQFEKEPTFSGLRGEVTVQVTSLKTLRHWSTSFPWELSPVEQDIAKTVSFKKSFPAQGLGPQAGIEVKSDEGESTMTTARMTMEENHSWLEKKIKEVCASAKKEGLPGNTYRAELFTSEGRVFSGEVEHLSGGWHIDAKNYPVVEGPAILRLTNPEGRSFEAPLATHPNGTIISMPTGRSEAVGV